DLDLSAVVQAEDLVLHLLAFLDHVGGLGNALLGQLADVDQAVARAKEVHEGAKIHHLYDLATVDLADLRLGHDRIDPIYGCLHGRLIDSSDLDRAIVLDVHLGSGGLADLPDDLAAGTDHVADLFLGDGNGGDTRCIGRHALARAADGLGHLGKDMAPAFGRLREGHLHDFLRDRSDLDVHLQRGDAYFRSGHLEIHVAEMVLVTKNVGNHRIAI